METQINNISLEMRWKMADWLAEERLNQVNKVVSEVQPRDTFYVRYGKRILDFCIALIAVIVFSPVNLVIGIITFFDVGSPILFKQERAGKNNKTFNLIKFRNMKNTIDEHGALLPAHQRVTKWGKFVRKTSMDELLNFISVLKGDMSIIGPRPLPVQYSSRYSKRHMQRLAVRPGLECPPMNVGNLRTWQDQFENDIWYVEHVSFLTDCKMLLKLVQFALDRKNSSTRGAAGRKAFMGYSFDGIAISIDEVPEEYITRAYHELYDEQERLKKM